MKQLSKYASLILLSLGVLMIAFGIGYSIGYNAIREVIDTQKKALDKSYQVISNNDLFDIDGSDEMSDYLELKCKADSLYRY